MKEVIGMGEILLRALLLAALEVLAEETDEE